MKKKLLFAIDSLDCAGAEKSLVTLLSLLDYDQYDVDLLLFAHGKVLEQLVPEQVNILQPLAYSAFAKLPLNGSLSYAVKHRKLKMFVSRVKYSLSIRRKQCTNPQKAGLFWRAAAGVIEHQPQTYDIAISYAQGVPTFYVAEKVSAAKKYAWVNVSYRLDDTERAFQKPYYDQYDGIVAVSDSTKHIFLETFPEFSHKIEVIYDIQDADFISQMAELGRGYTDGFDGIRILTIGRLAAQKGYDIALDACRKLKEKGVRFRWYALGKGPLKDQIEQTIRAYDLQDHFILLGVDPNPYPYIRQSDVYVQTSRFEGFGLAIAEARMLNVPVVTTRFDAVNNQMIDGKNGLIVDMNGDAVCEGILKIVNDHDLKHRIVQYLQSEKKGNVEQLHKFHRLIG